MLEVSEKTGEVHPKAISKHQPHKCCVNGQAACRRRSCLQLRLRRQPSAIPPPVNWDISGTPTERAMFHHVRKCTVAGFGAISFLEKLWHSYIIPLGYYSDSVKHGLIALGCAHRGFISDYREEDQAAGAQTYDVLATQQFSKAMKFTTRDMERLSSITLRTSLVSCLIFICFEIMQGSYDKALQHLRSGSSIMVALSKAATDAQAGLPLSVHQRCLAETVKDYYDQLCDLADMFTCLGCDAAYLLEEGEVIPDLSYFFRGSSNKDASKPYSSTTEARYDLHLVDRAFGKALRYNVRGSIPMNPISWTSFLDLPESMSPLRDDDLRLGEWLTARHLFDVFSSRLATYTEHLKSSSSTTRQQLWEARLMSVMQKDWSVIIKCLEAPSSQPLDRQFFQDLLEDAESLIYAEAEPMQYPVFTLGADVIPRMSLIAGFSGEPDLQQRAISLLYAMRRKEGMWDSREIASLLESILLARESSIWNMEYERISLPRIAGMLLSLKLYDGSSSLPLATLVD
ncbi:hypothetical protein BDP67DRAFT_222355 [Colletotrichum lupini]|nr:hypothetical protein BDP67DRAFT_222355 [Colletotrichum lupini]